jgi:8-amino-7-oxononanoate synthase
MTNDMDDANDSGDGHHPLKSRVAARLRAIRNAHLWRTLRPPTGIDLSSNDYLGLANHPRLKRAMIDAVERHGCGSTGSRLLRGDRDAFAAVERKFAAFKGAERALYFSSGYLANLAVLTTFPEGGDVIYADERNHASLIDASRLSSASRVVFSHGNLDALERLVRNRPEGGQAFVVTESLFSMDGDVPALGDYASICRSAGAMLVVDEAHAVGLYGARGSGLIEEHGIEHDLCLSINTAGKALGVSGAFVAGPAWAIDYLIQRARPFIFSTAPPPSLAAALDASLDIVMHEPERRLQLAGRAKYFRDALTVAGVPVPTGFSQIIPIVLGDNDRALAAADALQAQGFDVRAIRPPSVPTGTARLRISVNQSLTEETIDRFARALSAVLPETVLCSAVSS